MHKSFLWQESSILAEKFQLKKNGLYASKLQITGLSAEAVEAFLDYLYERKQPDRQNAMEIWKLAVKYEVASLKDICEKIIKSDFIESIAFEIFKLACGASKLEALKVSAFRKLKDSLGNELHDDLINNPERLQKIVDTLLDLMANTEN